MTVDGGTYDLTESLGGSNSIISASDMFEVNGDIEFTSSSTQGSRVLIMSGGDINPDSGTTISNQLDDLVVATPGRCASRTMPVSNLPARLVRSLRDIELQQVSLLRIRWFM